MKRIFLKSMISVLVSFSAVTACSAVSKNSNENVNKLEVRYETPKYNELRKMREELNKRIKAEENKIIETSPDEIKEKYALERKGKYLTSKKNDLAAEIEKERKEEIEKDKNNLTLALHDNTNDYFIIYTGKDDYFESNPLDDKEKQLSNLTKEIKEISKQYKLIKEKINKSKELQDIDKKINKKIININNKTSDEYSIEIENFKKQCFENLEDIRKKRYEEDKLILDIDDKSDKENLDEMKKKIINKYRYVDIPSERYNNEYFSDQTKRLFYGDYRNKERDVLFEDLLKEILAFCTILDDISFKNQITFYENIVDKEKKAMPVNNVTDVFKHVFTDIFKDGDGHKYRWAKSGEFLDFREKKLIFYNMKNKDKHKLKQALREELINYVPQEKRFLDVKYRIINMIKNKMREIKLPLSKMTINPFDYLRLSEELLPDRLKKIRNINFRDVENLIKNLKVEKFLNHKK